VRPISPEQRKQFEGMGVEAVRQFCSGNVWSNAQDGSTNAMKVSALIWLAEIDEEARKRTEALQAEQTRLAENTLKPAWIAAGAAIIGVIVGILAWISAEIDAPLVESHQCVVSHVDGRFLPRLRNAARFGDSWHQHDHQPRYRAIL